MLVRISNIFLSLMLVVITTGFTVSKHFCHDRLVNTELFSAIKSCHEIPDSCCEKATTSHCGSDMEKDDCCKNESDYVKFTEQFTLKQKDDSEKKQSGNSDFISVFWKRSFLIAESSAIKNSILQPPPIRISEQAFFQSFLI